MEESWGKQEFMGSGVEDQREAKSLALMADRLLANPELSFSSAVGKNLRKSAWRIFSKQEVDVSYGHYRQTGKRSANYEVVLVSQDTTDLNYAGHHATEGLGDIGGIGVIPGLCLHTAMALSEQGLPLGLVGQKLWAPVVGGKEKHSRYYALEEKESYRWVEALQWTSLHLAKVGQVIMLSDRESDFYEYMIAARGKNVDLLFRANYLQRRVYFQHNKMPLSEVVFPHATNVEVYLPATKKRKERTVSVQVSWGSIVCPAAECKQGRDVTLWMVVAKEIQPPVGEDPLLWYLLTTIAVESQATALQMVDYYRKRWVIERWHLVLKSGMQVEKLQFDTFTRLSHAIGMLSIVAWQLLWLKQLAAQSPDVAVQSMFDPLQVEVLEKYSGLPLSGKKQLNLRQALILIAALAGFTPSKKQPLPGEKTIWRGWSIFNNLCNGYKLAFQNNYETG
jgi:hypothetical protein